MSSDVDDDQVLPESLQKLEIVPVFSHSQSACKSNNERNPFFSELRTVNGIDDRITKDLFGPSCSNCESNDKPCSVNNDGANDKNVAHRIWRNQGKSCHINKVNKDIYFKHRDREKSTQILSERKLAILREPILKSIGRSVYHNGNQNKLCCEPKSNIELNDQCTNKRDGNATTAKQCAGVNGSDDDGSNSSASMSTNKNECRQATGTVGGGDGGGAAADPNNVMIHRIQNWQLNDDSTVDFKSLVNECNSLTLSTAHDAVTNSITELHKTRNFQILQANQIGSTVAASSSSTASSSSAAAAGAAAVFDANDTQSPNNNIHTTLSAAVNSAMNSSLSSNSSNSSSCSQQARMNSSNCDVTIDELASYIEFQLHLPKPMSSNVYEAMFS